MKIKILQISEKKDKRELMFLNCAFAEKKGGIDLSEYDEVWSGEVDTEELEVIYSIFNRRAGNDRIPEDFRGRSMSVSDIVVCDRGMFFCDSFGFKLIDGKYAAREGIGSWAEK